MQVRSALVTPGLQRLRRKSEKIIYHAFIYCQNLRLVDLLGAAEKSAPTLVSISNGRALGSVISRLSRPI